MKPSDLTMVEFREGVAIVNLMKKEFDMTYAQTLKRELIRLIDEGALKLIINLSLVDYLSTAVMAALVAVLKKLTEVKGVIRICGMNKEIRHIFDLTRLDKVFKIYDTEAGALEDLRKL